MHDFFNHTDAIQHGVAHYVGQQWVRDGFRRNVAQAISFYRRNPMAVKSDHFLVRLLGSLGVPQSQNLERYYDNVDGIALDLSMALKMTSSIYHGKVFEGLFYGPGTYEIVLAHTASFDFEAAHQNWQNVEAVKVLRCPRSDLGLNLPDGHISGTETGLAVIAINIPLLAVQYRAFRQAEADRGLDDSQKSVMQFLHMFVLPNMLWSQTEQVLFNRLAKLVDGQQIGESIKRHSFALPHQIDTKVTDLLRLVSQELERHHRSFGGMLQAIPAVVHQNMQEVMRVPAMAQTRQVTWALTISRLHVLRFLFHASAAHPDFRNRSDINQIERSFLAYRTGHVFEQYLPAQVQQLVLQEVDEILGQRQH